MTIKSSTYGDGPFGRGPKRQSNACDLIRVTGELEINYKANWRSEYDYRSRIESK